MSKVGFTTAEMKFELKGIRARKTFLKKIFVNEGKPLCTLEYIFCTDEYLLKLNVSFLKHDTYTDVITFDLSEKEDRCITGEVYISIERVSENAKKENISFDNELNRVMIHAALHLCGYNDKKKSEITLMRDKEEYYLRLFDEINIK
jgi:rRNA maturation RNase YbeY